MLAFFCSTVFIHLILFGPWTLVLVDWGFNPVFCIEGLGMQACFGKYIKISFQYFRGSSWPSKDIFSRIFLKDASGFVAGAVMRKNLNP